MGWTQLVLTARAMSPRAKYVCGGWALAEEAHHNAQENLHAKTCQKVHCTRIASESVDVLFGPENQLKYE